MGIHRPDPILKLSRRTESGDIRLLTRCSRLDKAAQRHFGPRSIEVAIIIGSLVCAAHMLKGTMERHV